MLHHVLHCQNFAIFTTWWFHDDCNIFNVFVPSWRSCMNCCLLFSSFDFYSFRSAEVVQSLHVNIDWHRLTYWNKSALYCIMLITFDTRGPINRQHLKISPLGLTHFILLLCFLSILCLFLFLDFRIIIWTVILEILHW